MRLGCAPESTSGALSASPLSSVTPVTRPPATSIDATDASVRISAPWARALAASASEIAPMPPLTCAHAPWTPLISPSAWCSRL